MNSPQQEIYDAVFKTCLDLGYSTFDYLPPDKTKLPFVFVGEQFDQDRNTKSVIFGDVQQSIHIYGTIRQRSQITQMINAIRYELRKLKKTKHFHVTAKQINGQILPDNTTSQPLLHGLIEVVFTFN